MGRQTREALLHGLKEHWGSIKEVAEKTELDRRSVGLILKGKWKNDHVLIVASEVLRERSAKRAKNRQLVERNIKQSIELAS